MLRGMKKYSVKLTAQERKKLLAIVSKGQNKASVIRRAHILLKSDEGKTDQEIVEMLYSSEDTISRTRQRFYEEGLEAALEDKPHPDTESKLDDGQEAYLVALACSAPPSGRRRWTLELLAKELIKEGIVEGISAETVRLMLKKTNSSLGG
jgi:transposase